MTVFIYKFFFVNNFFFISKKKKKKKIIKNLFNKIFKRIFLNNNYSVADLPMSKPVALDVKSVKSV